MMTKKLYLAGVIVSLLTLLLVAVVPSAPRADERANQKHHSPSTGPLAYALSFDGSLGQFGVLDIGSGVFSVIADLPNSGQGLGRDAKGHLYTVDTNNNLVRIKPANGKTKVVGSTGITTPGPVGSTLVDVFASLETGELFLMDYSNNLYSVDAKTGLATLVGATGIPAIVSPLYSSSLAGNCQDLFFTITERDATLQFIIPPTLYRIDPRTAVATLVGPTAIGMPGSGFIADVLYGFTLDQRVFGGTEGPHAVAIDVATGAATIVSDLTVPFVFGAVSLTDTVKDCQDHGRPSDAVDPDDE
jgi:hypothetical protein